MHSNRNKAELHQWISDQGMIRVENIDISLFASLMHILTSHPLII